MSAWLAVSLVLLAGGVWAAEGPLEAVVEDSEGRRAALSRWRGRPVVLFYEDKEASTQNAAFKQELFARARAQGLLEAAAVVAVADLQAFNFFPARQFALAAVRQEEKRWGVPILVDWQGTLRGGPFRLPARAGSVVLLDAQGREVWRYSGRLGPSEQEAFFQALGALLGRHLGPASQPAPAP